MSNIWFTSDWHLGHKNVLKFADNARSKVLDVSTIEEHDALICDAILSTIKKRDILYVLGDNGNAQASYDMLEKCQAMEIRYLPGNHDRDTGIAQLATLRKLKVWPPATYKRHWISHIPIHPVELWDRPCIHGHVHSVSVKDERYINVSVEAAGKGIVVNFNDIKDGSYKSYNGE